MDKNFCDVFSYINQYLLKSKIELQNVDTEELNHFMRTIKLKSHDKTFIRAFEEQYSFKQQQLLSNMLLSIECIVEKKSIIDYLNNNTKIIDEKLTRCTPEMVKEGRVFGLDKQSHLLLIGSGAMPISGVVLHRNYQCAVTFLDIDKSVLDISQEWIKTCGITAEFAFLCCDIFKLTDFSSYTHLLITGHIVNKDGLLKYLSNFLNNQKILLRNSVGLYQSVYRYTTNFSGYEILKIVDHGSNMPYYSIILKPAKPITDEIFTPFYEFSIRYNKEEL